SDLTVVGQDFSSEKRTPTVSFTVKGKTAEEVCRQLAAENICAWDGHFYAVLAIEVLGLLEKGGVTRMGISLYNTEQEIDYVIKAVKKLI
ncbi:MAG: aminotransferase class V-fold PLP-dependent enzyme, partial [Imperialibacter sp.]